MPQNSDETPDERRRRLNRESAARRKRENPAYNAAKRESVRERKKAGGDLGRAEEMRKEEAEKARALRERYRVEQESPLPRIAAKQVYELYRQRLGWPEVPPTGLRVAVARTSLGWPGWKPVVVRLEGGPEHASVPSFIADPALDLTNSRVRASMGPEGLHGQAYETARHFQDLLKSLPHVEGDGGHAESLSSYADQGTGVSLEQGEAQHGYFDGVDVDEIADAVTRSGLGGMIHGADAAWTAPGSWPGPFHAVELGVSGYDGYPVDALSQGMREMTIAAPASAQGGYRVAYSPWDNPYGEGSSRVADPQLNTAGGQSLVPGATAYLPPSQPAGFGDEPPAREARVYRHRTRHTRTR
ncbi:hypothetical protein [Streptomyces sp. NPDC006012]|uniref:hypothetical protein n=1 Tax=Streptomyces sp. NPDC006012 TaxID=3364739 RepID=UPI00368BA1E7